MIKVITYGTYDLLHEGHINLLKRAKALGDYLIVGVTTENFDVNRGKINVSQSLTERMEAVRLTGLADEIFPEEYEGQKIDDIKRNNIDIFAIGSDWAGKFDYLKEYCQVVYLPRTEGVSSTIIRSKNVLRLGLTGSDPAVLKFNHEAQYVNGISVGTVFFKDLDWKELNLSPASSYESLLEENDAVYIASKPSERYGFILKALQAGKHVIAESPIALKKEEALELFTLAHKKNLCLFDSIKTAYSLAFTRLVLLLKSGIIGSVKSIDSTCTSQELYEWLTETKYATSFTSWGAVAVLPVLTILGLNYKKVMFTVLNSEEMEDIYTKVNFIYDTAVATVNVGVGVKSEGDLRIAGTKGYIYVPAPWWKTDYFEVRFEKQTENKKYFYMLEGEGIRNELVNFARAINNDKKNFYLDEEITVAISGLMEEFFKQKG